MAYQLSKESQEKIRVLKNDCDKINSQNKKCLMALCSHKGYIFIPIGFYPNNDSLEIYIRFVDAECPKGKSKEMEINSFFSTKKVGVPLSMCKSEYDNYADQILKLKKEWLL